MLDSQCLMFINIHYNMVETEFIVYSVESIECKANQPFQEENGPYSTCKMLVHTVLARCFCQKTLVTGVWC